MESLAGLFAVIMAVGTIASARDNGQWVNATPEVRAWYRNAEPPPEAQKRLGISKCCDNADVVKTSFRVSKIDGHDEWYWLNGASWELIPADIIHWGESAPGGLPTLFVWNKKPTCFWPPEGGG